MWSIAICDDRPEVIEDVRNKLVALYSEDIGTITSYLDGKSMIADMEDEVFTSDIIIMDIELGNCNGIALADRILTIRPDCQIIFMSGYDDYYEKVYDVSHIYFMKKPVCDEVLRKALSKAVEKLKSEYRNFFTVQTKAGKHIISYHDIFSFERDKRKINVVGRNGELLCSFYGKFEDIEQKLPKSFHRCHNSIFINMPLVKSLEGGCFIMRDGRVITISRSHRSESQLAFAKYLTGSL